jgi:DNA invertase Pin-like site-specific DNA recombinase
MLLTGLSKDTTMPDAYSYVRFSTPEQMKGDSLRRQTKMSETFAKENNLTLRQGFTDLGVSGFRGKNRDKGALRAFLNAVEDGRIAPGSWLLIESLDRLSRDRVGEALPDFLNLLKAGIIVATLQDKRVYDHKSVDDPMQLVGSLIVISRAHEESAMKSHRTTEAWRTRREKGLKQALCPAWLKLSADGQSYDPIPKRLKVLTEIFDMATQQIGTSMIARILNERKIDPFSVKLEGKPRAGRQARGWHAASIRDLLTSRAVLGEHQPYHRVGHSKVPAGEPLIGFYPQVIDPGLFARAQAGRRKANTHKGRKGTAYSNLLNGLGFCARCGGPMRISHGARQTRTYLRCANASNGISGTIQCDTLGTSYFNSKRVEHQILHYVKEYRLSELFANPQTEADLKVIDHDLALLAEKISHLEEQQARLMRLITSVEEDDPVLEDYNNALRAQRADIRQAQEKVALLKDRRAELLHQQDQRTDIELRIVEQRMLMKLLQDEEVHLKNALVREPDKEQQIKSRLAQVYKDLLPIRAKLGAALRQFIDRAEFDQVTGQFDVIVAGGAARYRFVRSDKRGGLDKDFSINFVGKV